MLNLRCIFVLIHIQMFIVDGGLWENTEISISSFCDPEILAFIGSVVKFRKMSFTFNLELFDKSCIV